MQLPPTLKSTLTKTMQDYLTLTKFKLSLLNTIVALSGYMICPGSIFFSIQTLNFCTATQLMAMSSQAFNQIIERNYDKEMVRTCTRPIPKNRI